MLKREAAFQTKFNQWLRKHPQTGAFELKQCDESLPFKRLEEHQENALRAAKHGVLIYKIPDDTRSYKPFDAFCLSKTPAYVVILFRSRHFYCIDIDAFIEERSRSVRKSLLEDRAKEIASFADSV
jgi:hypothetical protein